MNYVNENCSLPKRGRKASTDVDALLAAIKGTEISRTEFSDESIPEKDFKIDWMPEENNCLLFKPYSSGEIRKDDITWIDCLDCNGNPVKVPVIFYSTGGDGSWPIAFALYLSDTGKLRVYVPKKGNCYNSATNMLFGNDYDEDREFLKSEGIDEDTENVEIDTAAVIEDTAARLLACYSNKTATSSNNTDSNSNKKEDNSLDF